MEKECFKCNMIKPITDFYKHKAMGDGHLNKCKECTKLDTFGRTHEEIEKRKHRDRNRSNKDERVKKNKDRLENDPIAKAKNSDQKKEWARKNKEKMNAHLKVARAVMKGTIKREYNCSKCDSDIRIEAHHEDYTKPLEVIWLCSKCHHERHVEIRNEQRSAK